MMCSYLTGAMMVAISLSLAGCGGGPDDENDNAGKAEKTAGADLSSNRQESDTGGDGSATRDSAQSRPAAPGDAIVRVLARPSNVATGVSSTPMTFDQVFVQGDVPAGESVQAAIDGHALPTQVDAKAIWPDGSLRHAVVTVSVPAAKQARESSIVLRTTGKAGADSAAVTTASLLGSDFEATADFVIEGVDYRASAHDALTRIADGDGCAAWQRADCKQWLSGELVSSWIVAATPTHGNTAADHLRVYFDIRGYDNGNVRVGTVVENALAYASSPHNLHYDVHLAVGDNHYDIDDLTHYQKARWHKVLWTRQPPAVHAAVDMHYLQASRAISQYADLSPGDRLLNHVRQQSRPMSHGDQTPNMGQTGAQAAIGALPRWTSAYVVSGDFYYL